MIRHAEPNFFVHFIALKDKGMVYPSSVLDTKGKAVNAERGLPRTAGRKIPARPGGLSARGEFGRPLLRGSPPPPRGRGRRDRRPDPGAVLDEVGVAPQAVAR